MIKGLFYDKLYYNKYKFNIYVKKYTFENVVLQELTY